MTDGPSGLEKQRIREICRFENGAFFQTRDALATEEPLEIRVDFGVLEKRKNRSLSITMRTPGHDTELAAGFLLGEGIVATVADIERFEFTGPKKMEATNQLCVHLNRGVAFDFGSLQRNFYTTSSCGICGRASLDAVRAQLSEPIPKTSMHVSSNVILGLSRTLRLKQQAFEATGGLHGVGLFSADGILLSCFEDVGRHNALDKLVGHHFLAGDTPLAERIAMVSGRASFELVQKAISAGIPILVAVGAPSSLAAELAEEFGVTLIGFASGNRFNVYCHKNRVVD